MSDSVGPLKFAGESNLGLHREKNDDSFCLIATPGVRNQLAVVADGVGGHADGALASFLCCRRLLLNWRQTQAAHLSDIMELTGFLVDAVEEANSEIYRQNRAVRHTPPMCTTVIAAVFTPDAVLTVHVGDSRFYIYSDNRLIQLTRDHSLKRNGMTNVISRAVGPMGRINPDINIYERRPSDRFMICSDGLMANLSDEQITAILAPAPNPHQAVDDLMRAALLSGGVDNITVICVF